MALLTREDSKPEPKSHSSKTRGWGIFLIVLGVIIILISVGFAAYRHLRARRLGLPTSYNPFRTSSSARARTQGSSSSSSGGPLGWIKTQFNRIKNGRHRTAGGAYEETLGSVGGGRRSHRGFGPLDPDEAWDSRVGNEADTYGPGGYYEEQELGLHGGDGGVGPYGGSEYGGGDSHLAASHSEFAGVDGGAARGRSRERDPTAFIGGDQHGLDERYDQEMGRSTPDNPFADSAETSHMALRELSPKPADNGADGGRHGHS
ncbi:MAG: hypothetical protein M1816_004934 [Peltula sp. TS41687]|nr:MAG: hypothetical protein M1816_004934 [Peltula sp. TS41687]